MNAVFWVVLGVVLAVAEIFTTTLFLIMFSVGAFAAAGAAALGAPTAVQALVFAGTRLLRPAHAHHVDREDEIGIDFQALLACCNGLVITSREKQRFVARAATR